MNTSLSQLPVRALKANVVDAQKWRLARAMTAPAGAAEKPVCARKFPYLEKLEPGKKYFWCACGKSAKQPFCDGSHKGTSFKPLAFEGEGYKLICACKGTKTGPYCDRTHVKKWFGSD